MITTIWEAPICNNNVDAHKPFQHVPSDEFSNTFKAFWKTVGHCLFKSGPKLFQMLSGKEYHGI